MKYEQMIAAPKKGWLQALNCVPTRELGWTWDVQVMSTREMQERPGMLTFWFIPILETPVFRPIFWFSTVFDTKGISGIYHTVEYIPWSWSSRRSRRESLHPVSKKVKNSERFWITIKRLKPKKGPGEVIDSLGISPYWLIWYLIILSSVFKALHKAIQKKRWIHPLSSTEWRNVSGFCSGRRKVSEKSKG